MPVQLRDKLIGGWSLISFESESIKGNISFPFGRDAKGELLYSHDGFVAVNIMQSGRESAIAKLTHDQPVLRYSELSYIAYSGLFIIDESRPSVTHVVEVSLYPEWVGQKQFRLITWIDDNLQLSTESHPTEDQNVFRLLWKRTY